MIPHGVPNIPKPGSTPPKPLQTVTYCEPCKGEGRLFPDGTRPSASARVTLKEIRGAGRVRTWAVCEWHLAYYQAHEGREVRVRAVVTL